MASKGSLIRKLRVGRRDVRKTRYENVFNVYRQGRYVATLAIAKDFVYVIGPLKGFRRIRAIPKDAPYAYISRLLLRIRDNKSFSMRRSRREKLVKIVNKLREGFVGQLTGRAYVVFAMKDAVVVESYGATPTEILNILMATEDSGRKFYLVTVRKFDEPLSEVILSGLETGARHRLRQRPS